MLENEIKARGQSFIKTLEENKVLNQLMEYIFLRSSSPAVEASELTQSTLEAKLYLLRQRALESRESFEDNAKLITGVIQNNRYIAFKGIIKGVLSFPI